MAKDYYKILGVSKDASKEEIKKAYKQMAKKFHPDLNKDHNDGAKFKEVSEAAAVLGDDQKRSQYDQFGNVEDFQKGSGFQGFDFNDFGQGQGFDFDNIFESLFGGGGDFSGFGSRRGPKRGSDLRYDMEIILEEAAFGAEKTVIIPKLERCDKCSGTGAAKGGKSTCSDCGGKGVVQRTQRTPFGYFSSTTACRKCGGTGQVIKNPCEECEGEGRVEQNKKIKINIPAGVDTGSRLRINGEGEAGEQGAPHGDLYIITHVKPHNIFERQGNDLYVDIPLTITQAALGTEIKVPTIQGHAVIKIPEGTQSGTIFKLKGKGIPDLHSSRVGDEKVRVMVETPTKLTKKQKEILEEFSETLGETKNAPNKGLFEHIKKAFE